MNFFLHSIDQTEIESSNPLQIRLVIIKNFLALPCNPLQIIPLKLQPFPVSRDLHNFDSINNINVFRKMNEISPLDIPPQCSPINHKYKSKLDRIGNVLFFFSF